MDNWYLLFVQLGFLVAGLIHVGEMIYYSRRAAHLRPEWKGRLWTMGILSCLGGVAFVLLMWQAYLPQPGLWTTPLCSILSVGLPVGIAYRLLLRRILR